MNDDKKDQVLNVKLVSGEEVLAVVGKMEDGMIELINPSVIIHSEVHGYDLAPYSPFSLCDDDDERGRVFNIRIVCIMHLLPTPSGASNLYNNYHNPTKAAKAAPLNPTSSVEQQPIYVPESRIILPPEGSKQLNKKH